jgi:phosphoenolpyruvate synthase/pyruvate phosphate dikinase
MTEKWTKVVARNCYPVHWSAQMHQKQEGITLGKLHWRLTRDLLIKCDTPLSHVFAYNGNAQETNFVEMIHEQNYDLDTSLQQATDMIEEYLKLQPGSSYEEAAKLYADFKLAMGLMVMGFWFNLLIEDVLKSHFDLETWDQQRDQVMHPFRKTLLARENDAIWKLQQQHSHGTLDEEQLNKAAEELAKEYGFIHSEYKAKEWTIDDYACEIKEKPKAKEQAEPKLESSCPDEYVNWLVECAGKCVYIFDEGKAALVRANWALRKTLTNMNCDESLVLNCTELEFKQWTQSHELPSVEALRERDRYHAIKLWDGQYYEYTSQEEVEKLVSEETITEFNQINEDIQQIKGQVAFRGLVKGRVRVLFSQQDADRLEEGEILVASMTTPELLSAMRKARAFITDEGGITCHAAIIAREFKTPCVIGTKVATKALKDGDLVEVDANTGIIKISTE